MSKIHDTTQKCNDDKNTTYKSHKIRMGNNTKYACVTVACLTYSVYYMSNGVI